MGDAPHARRAAAEGEGGVIRLAAPMLLAIGVPLFAIVLWRLRNLPAEHAGARRRVIQSVVLLAVACAALALAGLELGTRVDRLGVVFALDRSRSVERSGETGAEEAVGAMRDAIETMRADDRAGLVVFGAEATTEVLPSPRPSLAPRRASVARDATDIAAALRRALADLPAEHAGRIVLVSDGVETTGDALAAAQIASGRGVLIDVLPIDRAPQPEVAVERVRIPPTARPDEPVEVRIVTRATRETRARVRVLRDGEPIAESETTLAAGDDILVMRDRAASPGVHRYDVVIDPIGEDVDAARDNNEGGAFMRVLGGSRALVLANEPEAAGALAEAIRRGGIEVEVGGPRAVPVDLASLASYDLLVLSDLEARAFSEDQMRMVQSYVRDLGGGLLMVGARDSFGLGGYAYTPIEEALPATFDLRRRRDRASLAMVIAIDKSGSMTVEVSPGRTKLDLANEAAARSAMLLSPRDRIGVMHVDEAVTWTQPMVSIDDPAPIASVIRAAQPGGGGIYVDVAMRESFEALRSEQTQLKHLLLFSDGDDSENLDGMRDVVRAAFRDRITTSIVSMGNGVFTPELEQLSRIGGGRFYIVEDMTELPRIFTQETIEASRAALKEEPFRARAAAPGAPTRGIDFNSAPALGGYAIVNARPRATTLLAASEEDPLLLTWQHGVGRSAVLTTDAGAELARSWLAWPGYVALFSQLTRDIARAPERSDARVSVSIRDGVGHVRVEAVSEDGRYQNYLDLAGTVAAPGGRRIDVPLAQTGAGRYEGTFDANAPGPYLVTVREQGAGLVGSAGIVRPRGDELRGEGTDRAKLAQIAALTGGRVLPNLETVFTDRPPPAWSYAPLWEELLAAALMLMLLSVTLRRLVLPRDLLARLVPAPLRRVLRVRRAVRRPVHDPLPTLDALTAARARANDGGGEVAAEVRRALEAAPLDAPRHDAAAVDPDVPAPAEPAAAPAAEPASLAEQLLARKRKK